MRTNSDNKKSRNCSHSLSKGAPSYSPENLEALLKKINKEQEVVLQLNEQRQKEFKNS